MTKRVVAALVLLTLAILGAAVVPLGLGAIDHARDAFVYGTARTADSIAGIADAKLGDNAPDPALTQAMVSAARQHDELLLLDKHGHVVVSQGVPANGDWRNLVAQATQQSGPSTELTSRQAIAVQIVWGDGSLSGTPIGTVVLERPTAGLNHQIEGIWLYLIGLGGAAMAAAVLIAIYFARWVGRPLARLDAAARKIADGDLAVRARTRYGPPEVRRMAATFNMMAGRLEALVHGHRAMLADASHQLRTPLTALRLRLDLLAVDSSPATAAELAGAQEEIARLSRLVDGLLATARAEALTEQLEQTDVAEVVHERADAWQPVGDSHGVKLIAEPAPGLLVALGAGHLEQVLDNVIDNAIEAIGDTGGTVHVSAARSETGVILTVADDGPGMTPQERSRAFLRFTTGSQNGTGLGLAIVHRLVTANGGAIRLADTPGGGLTVEVEFPESRWPPRLYAMAQPWWKPVWSVPAAMRAARATVVVPSLFAITDKVVGNPQMALFATFGGFATLVIASFNGTRRDKLVAHLGLAVAGSLALIIGTLVSGTTWLAAVVTVPVTFAIFFAGIGGPNAASGCTAAMFAYVLPVASAGDAGMIPSRLAGWWLASAAGTIAVLLLSPRAPGSQLRAAAANLAGELASRVRAAAAGELTKPEAMLAAKERLRTAFTAAPYRPTGLAAADQALSSLVQLLEWAASQASDAFDGHIDLTTSCPQDRDLLRRAAGLFDDASALLSGLAAQRDAVQPDVAGIEAARARSAERLRELSGRPGEPDARLAAAQAVHAQGISVVAESAVADALIVSHRASRAAIAAEQRQWYGLPDGTPVAAGLTGAVTLVRRHASVRSVWFLNSLRGAVALAAAVAVADLSGVQHGFWVVLGTLSVLRTSAAATGATAWRALAGTAIGFAVGAALLVGIGTAQAALWVALPLAIAIAAYAPGTTPFLVGQAAFTVTIVVLFNLLVPAGWRVGLLRVEDVAIGCAVSLAVGVLFWPRGVASVVGDDLADTFRTGAAYLTQAVDWALSELLVPPAAAVAAVSAGIRLDDAVRGLLTEQGSKKLGKEDLWALVNASTRLRLTAHSLAELRPATPDPGAAAVPGAACLPLEGSAEYAGAPACISLRSAAAGLAGFYTAVAGTMSRPGHDTLAPVPAPPVTGGAMPRRTPGEAPAAESIAPAHQLPHPHLLWVQEHLHHLGASAQTVSGPALRLAEVRQRPWWR